MRGAFGECPLALRWGGSWKQVVEVGLKCGRWDGALRSWMEQRMVGPGVDGWPRGGDQVQTQLGTQHLCVIVQEDHRCGWKGRCCLRVWWTCRFAGVTEQVAAQSEQQLT